MDSVKDNSLFEGFSSRSWEPIEQHTRTDEADYASMLCQATSQPPQLIEAVQQKAASLIQKLRQSKEHLSILEQFLSQYSLSSGEGVALMCLAEALLRIPDAETRDKLISDKLSAGKWRDYFGQSDSLFVNAATFGLMLTGKITKPITQSQSVNLNSAFNKLLQKGGEPIVRKAIAYAMKILGEQFVMGQTIEGALKRSQKGDNAQYRYSFDMLGEVALTQADAERYYARYEVALTAIEKHGLNGDPTNNPGISVKLSAITPRYQLSQLALLQETLYPKLKALVLRARELNIGLTIDAEESQTLLIQLQLVKRLFEENVLGNWMGFGIVVQAYQKRAPYVIDWLVKLAREYQNKLMIRLVKGAYWDIEIKQAQVQGLSGYPVFTRKVTTDLNYQWCAQKLFAAMDCIYPQFATHNAYTVALIQALAAKANCTHYEFQRLHGMGEGLYETVVAQDKVKCRVYAPVGSHEDLLSYLVRRLLENGANTSFVNRLVDEKRSVESLTEDPHAQLMGLAEKAHPQIPLPMAIYEPDRQNAPGLDLTDPAAFLPVLDKMATLSASPKLIEPLSPNAMMDCVTQGYQAFDRYQALPLSERVKMLKKMATLLNDHRTELMHLLVTEAGKTLDDALSEVREAIDFCYYYAEQANAVIAPKTLKSATGEDNRVGLFSRGLMLCISPWNFPLAIFLGQVTANLAAGNTVLAKPAGQTFRIAQKAVELLHKAGFEEKVVQLLPISGRMTAELVLPDHRVQGVVFTGSTETAQSIQQTLTQRGGNIVPLIAETGGINAMVVDASALPEQVVQDVILSAFKSAGQRCSALRVLLIQEDVADKMIAMLKGAMAMLTLGNPAFLSTDIGPVIDDNAKKQLLKQIEALTERATCLFEYPLSESHQSGAFVGPIAFEIQSLNDVKEEIFGPVLQVMRYRAKDLPHVIEQVNALGYGLTFGIHSRINSTIEWICQRIKVGNIYVNRGMTGAIVGVQPFGGEGLSGTGPKAGGQYYLPRLMVERAVSVNTMAQGGNPTLYMLDN